MQAINLYTFICWTIFIAVMYYYVGKRIGINQEKTRMKLELDKFYYEYMQSKALQSKGKGRLN